MGLLWNAITPNIGQFRHSFVTERPKTVERKDPKYLIQSRLPICVDLDKKNTFFRVGGKGELTDMSVSDTFPIMRN